MTPRDWILQTAARFREGGIPDPVTDSALILSHLMNRAPLTLRTDMDTMVEEAVLQRAEKLCRRRLTREPLQYILGEAPFCGRMFAAGSGMLIPRPETEELCRWAIEKIRGLNCPRILDVCAGSGCIGMTMKMECQGADVLLLELSDDALKRLKENMHRFSAEVQIRKSDLFSALTEGEAFDLILSNPPYIPSGDCDTLQAEVMYEPRMALDGGTDGLHFYRRIAREARPWIRKDGWLMMEIGDGQGENVSRILETCGWQEITVRQDLAGKERMICAAAPDTSGDKRSREEL